MTGNIAGISQAGSPDGAKVAGLRFRMHTKLEKPAAIATILGNRSRQAATRSYFPRCLSKKDEISSNTSLVSGAVSSRM